MTSANVPHALDVALSRLDPAPPWTPCGTAHIARLAERHPCIRCGGPATVAADAIEDPAFGRRWVDRCTPSLAATTPRTPAPRPPVADVLAVVRAAAREIGAVVTVVCNDSYR